MAAAGTASQERARDAVVELTGLAGRSFGDLGTALRRVLHELTGDAAPGLFAGASPAVRIEVSQVSLTWSAGAPDGVAGPHRERASQTLPVDRHRPLGPYRLAVAGPAAPATARGVRLLAGEQVIATLQPDEVEWDTADGGRSFVLTPRPHRSLTAVTGVQVGYRLDAPGASLSGRGIAQVTMTGAPEAAARALTVAIGLVCLDVDRLLAALAVDGVEGGFRVVQRVTSLSLIGTGQELLPGSEECVRLLLDLGVELSVARAVRPGEVTLISPDRRERH